MNNQPEEEEIEELADDREPNTKVSREPNTREPNTREPNTKASSD